MYHMPLASFMKHETIEDSKERGGLSILFFHVCLCVHGCITDERAYEYTYVKVSLRCDLQVPSSSVLFEAESLTGLGLSR